MKTTKNVNPIFTLWYENKTDQPRKYFISDLRQQYYKWLSSKEKSWLEYIDSATACVMFISGKDGLNSTYDKKDWKELYRLLTLEYNKVLSEIFN